MISKEVFHRFAARVSVLAGTPTVFVLACLTVLVWAVTGPLFNFSGTWQLTINTFTTIVTFLMVFLIQNSQNREAMATNLKLDELVRSISNASNRLLDAEDLTEAELEELHEEYRLLRLRYERVLSRRQLAAKHKK